MLENCLFADYVVGKYWDVSISQLGDYVKAGMVDMYNTDGNML